MGNINYVRVLRKDLQNPSKPKLTYAQSQARAELDLNDIAKHMTDHGSSFSRGTIAAVLSDAVDHIRELICDGNIVRLGDLGTFNVTLKCEGVNESKKDDETGKFYKFTANNIREVRCRFTPGKYLTNLRSVCTFTETMSAKTKAIDLSEKTAAIQNGTWQGDKGLSGNGGGGNGGGGNGGGGNGGDGYDNE